VALAGELAQLRTLDDVLLVLSELFTNAVEASVPDETVSVCVELTDPCVLVSVSNVGASFEPAYRMASSAQVGGRGLGIVRALGHTSVVHSAGVTTVTVEVARSPMGGDQPEVVALP
jgi:anti-sigma regulatory factor (Ser/Thr protein kinase)